MDINFIPNSYFDVAVRLFPTAHIKEGDGSYEGLVIAKKNGGINSAFTVRKISSGEGVERVFQTHSPIIDEVKVIRKGRVRRAKLYYMRGRTGKAARIKEKV